MAIVFVLMFLVVRSIARPLEAAVDRVRDIAEGDGDLTQRLEADSDDEIGRLSGWLNKFIGNIEQIIGNLHKTGSSRLTSSSESSTKRARLCFKLRTGFTAVVCHRRIGDADEPEPAGLDQRR